VISALYSVARATAYEFKEFAVHGFSLNAPEDWTVIEDKVRNIFDFNSPDGSIIIVCEGKSESITFLYASSEGLYPRSFAEMVAGLLHGSDPAESSNGDFEFKYTNDGIVTEVRTRQVGHLGIVMESTYGFDDILEILETLY